MLTPASANSKSYKLITPMSTNSKIPLISVRADTGKYVKSIIQNRDKMLGKTIMAGVKEYSVEEAVHVLAETGGLDVVAEKCAYGEYKDMLVAFGMPEFVADDMTENMKYFEEYGFFGGGKVENDHSVSPQSCIFLCLVQVASAADVPFRSCLKILRHSSSGLSTVLKSLP